MLSLNWVFVCFLCVKCRITVLSLIEFPGPYFSKVSCMEEAFIRRGMGATRGGGSIIILLEECSTNILFHSVVFETQINAYKKVF